MKVILRLILFISLLLAFSIVSAEDFNENTTGFQFFKEGVNHFNRKSFEASIDFFRKTLGKNPGDLRARFFLGLAYYKAGFNESALFEFNTILENQPGNEIISNFARYLSTNQFFLRTEKKNDDYTIGRVIQGNPIGKYILSRVTGIDVDDSGNIYAAGFGSKIGLKISQEGKPLLSFSSPKIITGRLYDIVTGTDGIVYISDFSNDIIYKFRDDGKYLDSIGEAGAGIGQFYGPTSLALDKNNDLYVIDSGNVRIEKFSPEGTFLLTFGSEGDAEDQLRNPSGIAVDDSGNIYVADHGKKAIMVFDRNGNYIRSLQGIKLIDPYGISFSSGSRLIVSDKDKIRSYNLMYSTWTEIDTGQRITRVLDVKTDRLGQLYACDFEKDNIIKFVPKADKYRNLNVILDRVDASGFPAVVYYVTVLDADGFPIYGLTRNNFLLKMGGGIVGKIELSYNEVRDSRLKLLFLIDKSTSMQPYREDIDTYLSSFISRISPEDEMAVVGFNSESWIASPFTRLKLRTSDAILEERFDAGREFDRAFRMSIDYINKEFYKKAVIVITDGILDDQSFRTYSFNSCIKYASNNHIPVYFLSFGGEENNKLDYFARNTGGKFYDVIHSNDYPYLYNTIQEYRSPEYIIFFNDVYDPKLENFYLDVEVEVDFNKRFGKSQLGLIYP